MKNKTATDIIEKKLSYEIVNAAFEVHNVLGPGFLEVNKIESELFSTRITRMNELCE
jgi:hypothetical protein